jgi:hypothetical protein
MENLSFLSGTTWNPKKARTDASIQEVTKERAKSHRRKVRGKKHQAVYKPLMLNRQERRYLNILIKIAEVLRKLSKLEEEKAEIEKIARVST